VDANRYVTEGKEPPLKEEKRTRHEKKRQLCGRNTAGLRKNKLKMGEIVKSIITHLSVTIPVTTPADTDVKHMGNAEDKAGEQIKAGCVTPVNRIRTHVNSKRRDPIVKAVRPVNLAMTRHISPMLSILITVATHDYAIKPGHDMKKQILQDGVTSAKQRPRMIGKYRHGRTSKAKGFFVGSITGPGEIINIRPPRGLKGGPLKAAFCKRQNTHKRIKDYM